MLDLGELFAKLSVDFTDLEKAERAARKFADKTKKHFEKVERAGNKLKDVGGKLTKNLTLPLVAVGTASVVASQKFNKAMREVNSLLGESSRDFQGLKKDVKSVSAALGIEMVEAANGAYQAISASVPRENLVSFLDVAGRSSIAGVTKLETAVDGLSTVTNAWGSDAGSTEQIADIMFTTVKNGKTTFEELSRSMHNVAGLGPALGVDFKEIAAATATLTKQGVPTNVAMTQMRAAMVALSKPNKEMVKLLQAAGIESIKGSIATNGLAGTYEKLREAANGSELQNAIGSVEALGFVLGTTGDNAHKLEADMKAMQTSAGAMDSAFKELDKARGFDRLVVSLQQIATTIGDVLLPIIEPVVTQFATWLAKVGELDQGLVTWVVGIAAAVAALGPLIAGLGVFILLAKQAMIIVTTAKALFIFAKSTVIVTKTLAVMRVAMLSTLKVLLAILAPVALVIAAITAVGAIIAWATGEFDQVEGWSKNLSFVEKSSRILHATWLALKAGAYALMTGLAEMGRILMSLGRFAEDFAKLFKIAFQAVSNGVKTAVNAVIGAINKMIQFAIKGVNTLIRAVNKIPKVDIGTIDANALSISKLELGAIDKFSKAGKGAGEKFMEGLRDELAAEAGKNIEGISDALNGTTEQPEFIKSVKQMFEFNDPGIKDGITKDIETMVKGGVANVDIPKGDPEIEFEPDFTIPPGSAGATADKVKEHLEEVKRNLDSVAGSIIGGSMQEDLATNFSDMFDNRIEAEKSYYEESLAALNEAESLKIDSIKPYHELREELERQHQQKLKNLEADRLDQQLSGAAQFFGNLTKLGSVESKKAQKIAKAAAIAEATINTYRSAVSAYAFGSSVGGPIVGSVFAAGAVAAGFANISKIRSAKATGGEVFANGAYQVNERGPEMLSTNDGHFLMMGNEGGKVTPFDQLMKGMKGGGGSGDGGGGTNVFVEIINKSGANNVTVTEDGDDEERRIKVVIDRITSNVIRGDGEFPQALESVYKVSRTGS